MFVKLERRLRSHLPFCVRFINDWLSSNQCPAPARMSCKPMTPLGISLCLVKVELRTRGRLSDTSTSPRNETLTLFSIISWSLAAPVDMVYMAPP